MNMGQCEWAAFEDQPGEKDPASWFRCGEKALERIGGFRVCAGHAHRSGMLASLRLWDQRRAEALEAQAAFPVVVKLKADAASYRERLEKGAAYVARTDLNAAERHRAFRLLRELVDALEDAQAAIAHLPASTVCVCRSCKTILLPKGGALFACCGAVWGWDNRAAYAPLPADFWAKHMPGDTYKKRLEDNFTMQEEILKRQKESDT